MGGGRGRAGCCFQLGKKTPFLLLLPQKGSRMDGVGLEGASRPLQVNCGKGIRLDIKKKLFLKRVVTLWCGGVGVTNPGGVQEMWGYGLRDTPTTGWVGLDVGIRAVFSKHDDLTFVCTGDGVWCGFAQLEAPMLQLRSGFCH